MSVEQIELHVDVVQKQLKSLARAIDNDVKTGKEARELQDFVQDEMLPVMSLIAQDIRTLAEIVMEHDESIADMGPDPSATQIQAEHAKELLDHITACNTILEQLIERAKVDGVDGTPIKQRLAVGQSLMEFIQAVTIESIDSDDDDEGD